LIAQSEGYECKATGAKLQISADYFKLYHYHSVNSMFKDWMADPDKSAELKRNWRAFILAHFPNTPSQKKNLMAISSSRAAEIQQAIASAVDTGGAIKFKPGDQTGILTMFIRGGLKGRGRTGTTPVVKPLFYCSVETILFKCKVGSGTASANS
jgi:hypothetical protein